MKITSQEIRDKMQAMWPDLEYIWLWDTTYWAPNIESVESALETSNVPTMDFIDQFNDCDNFALQFLAECRRKRYFQWKAGNLPEEQRYSMTVGYVFGDMFRGIGKVHAANVVLDKEGDLYMLDATPTEKRMWRAKRENDNVLFVFM
jgi:hypothetical protein